MIGGPQSGVSDPKASEGALRHADWALWVARSFFLASALCFALFVRVTLYGRSDLSETGVKGLVIPVLVFGALVAWLWLAARVMVGNSEMPSGLREGLIAATFAPLLAGFPVVLGVLQSEAYAREYWIDRSLKIELLLGLPALVLLLQVGSWTWLRYRLTWRRAGPMLAVLVAGFGLRLAGMGWGLPYAFQPEESSIYLRWAMDAALGGQWNPHYFQNPSLLIYLFGLEFSAVFAVCRALLFGKDPSELYMLFRGEQELFYGLARLNSVVLGTATLFVVYLVARRLWGERVGLVAAALLGVNFLHVRNSQYAVNDVPSAFFLMLSFYFAVRLAEDGALKHYLLAGLMAGLAASTKYNAGLIVVAVAVAHWARGKKLSDGFEIRSLCRLALSAGAALAGFVVGTPFSVLDFRTFRGGFLSQLDLGQTAWSGQAEQPTIWLFLSGAAHGAGLVAAGLAVWGAIVLLLRDRRTAAVVLVFPLSYLAFMSAMDLFFVRWVVPFMPFVALLAAYGLWECVRLVQANRRSLVAALLIVAALLQPALFSLRLDWLVHRVDTRQEANLWAERNLPEGSMVAVEAFSLLDQESLAFRATLQSLNVELVWRATQHDLDYYRQQGFDYLAVSSFIYDRAFAQPDKYPDRVAFYRQLDRELQLVAAFIPRADGRSPTFALDDLDTPFWHLFEYDRPGPTIKVYRVSR